MNENKQNISLNQYIDQTLLKADATSTEILQLVIGAKYYEFKAVCINPCFVKLAKSNLLNSKVNVCTVIGFPLGSNTTETKLFEANTAIQDGADEIDMVINIGALKENNSNYVLNEIKQLKNICENKVILKVIIETALLTKTEIINACQLVSIAKADFIKTSTGFAKAGASVADVKLIKEHLFNNVQIKASGGIKTVQQAIALINAGASRIGTSNGIALVTNMNSNEEY